MSSRLEIATKQANEERKRKLTDAAQEERLAIRYFLKRTKKMPESYAPSDKVDGYESLYQPPRQRNVEKVKKNLDISAYKLRRTETFAYLNLAPVSKVPPKSASDTRKKEKSEDDKNFLEPKIIECSYCVKIFFNKIAYRRHALKHVKYYRCGKCNRHFRNWMTHKRHEIECVKHWKI
ncbi:uncharacterized protein LOC135169255 [Diachasmimorpha longicaudata]|uniref:uncharacterized protein LOC135169255 n=1 Tax=Diachasmimorpha longicaudata TaxID=58733 RepID=UPI0030B8AE90